jgi:hypothetical protein
MKNILILGAFLIVVLSMLYFVLENKKAEAPKIETIQRERTVEEGNKIREEQSKMPPKEDTVTQNSRIALPADEVPEVPLSKLKVANFSGKLEKVDTGCFADGECYVEVDGKHITAIMGWSRETVGQVLGVDGFGDLESHLGKTVEVYAQDTSDGKYTLYGNEGFYIKLVK